MTQLLFARLGDDALTDGKAIDGLVPGTFITMRGYKIEIKKEDIQEYYNNTLAAIQETISESGDLVGLPIDQQNHEEDDAAGWVVGAELEGDLIRLVVRWTEKGIDVISKKLRKYFSANLDLVHKVIQGGSLTNWPATRDIETGFTLLRPVELAHLSQDVFMLGESLDEVTSRVRQSWWDQEVEREGEESWVVEVFSDHVIIERSDGYFNVAFSEADGEYTFAGPAEWKKVEKSWIELARETARRILGSIIGKEVSPGENKPDDNETNELGANDDPSIPSKGDEIMTVELKDLSKEDQTSLVAQLASQLGVAPESLASTDAGAPIAKLQEHIATEAQKLADEMLATAKRDADIVKLATVLVGATDENPVGLPVTEDALVVLLKSLTDEQREDIVGIFEKIRSEGLVGFSEKGHKKRIEGKTELDGEMKVLLSAYLKEDEDATVAEFFNLNAADLGAMEDYNLAEFEPKKEGK